MGIETSIPIVYITDNNYTMPTVVSITSLLKNAKNPPEIYVLGIDLSDENSKIFKEFNGVELLNLENKYADLNTAETYVSKAALFKFDLAEIFTQYDKILYIDCDTLILDDLRQFLKADIKDVYACVIKDCVGEIIQNDCERLNIKNYFNSGVMLLNAEKMRQDNIKEKLFCDIKSNLNTRKYMEQDVLNIVFNNCVRFSIPDFNYMVTNKKLMTKTVEKFYGVKKIKPKIIHFTSFKPWDYKKIPYYKEWMKYYNLSLFKDKKLNLKENPEKFALYKKQPFNDRWVVDFLGMRFSYKKGGKGFRLFYP